MPMQPHLSRTGVILLLTLPLLALSTGDQRRVFLIGDSTMADKPPIGNPERGWGEVFPLFFPNGVSLENHARNGRSTKSFLAEGRWQAVYEKLQAGDYVFIQFGHNDAKKLFLWVKPGVFSALRDGKQDNTHFTEFGALKIAGLVAEGLEELNLALSKLLRPVDVRSMVGLGKIVCLDNFYNNEWRKDAKGKAVRFHYVWEDTTNSGFSVLGSIITKLGASIDTLCEAPTAEALSRASIYIIVDPDTPKETEHPNYVEPPAIDAIAGWVRSGGVLVLMENDKGNAEFEHFNQLAARFGIHFNEESRNRVTGNAYDMGKFDSFPDHPLFKGVRQIYMKEICTLRVQEPATALLSDHGDVIIAFASVGKGAVLAVGDPWLYNEYITHRRLPAAYQNDKAAENLFRWLLDKAQPIPAN